MKQPPRIMVAGIGTDVGKTLVSAILMKQLNADYWKPVQSGVSIDDYDSKRITSLLQLSENDQKRIHPETYTFKACLSPHTAAAAENISIDVSKITPPQTHNPLIIESAGGVLVPLTVNTLTIDLFMKWGCQWIIVSRHYLGSINHTLSTVEALKSRGAKIRGLIFNGNIEESIEKAILTQAKLPLLGRLYPEHTFNLETIERYAKSWTQI